MQALRLDDQIDYHHYTDEHLLELVNQRDPYAYELFYDRHAPIVYNLLIHIVHDSELAELLLQTIFLQVWQETATCIGVGAVHTWLYRKARNKALDLVRQQQAKGARQPSSLVAPPANDQRDQPTPQSRPVISILQEMPAAQRQCIELAYFAGMSQSQIASYTNLPLETIKSHVRVGIATLAESLDASEKQKIIRLHDIFTKPNTNQRLFFA